jgi:AcrR family transcriptional regulator
MGEFDKYFTNEAKQSRSTVRVEKILDTVEDLAKENKTKKVSIQEIAKRCFISIGAIYHHFTSLDGIYASLMVRRVKERIAFLQAQIDSLGPDVTLNQFSDLIIDKAFGEWKINPIIAKKKALNYYYKNANQPEEIYTFGQMLYPNINSFVERNTTDTIRPITEQEWDLYGRLVQTAMSGPFLEDSPQAGNEDHRRLVKDLIVRLFGK